ncbi:hypothetical protein ASPWEDRAFT_43993 [Aspergillus wentii DTO 134E9]|uniref:NAD-dependent epimerase/dehydratase domain-containing protein n=1 Tax=Aspergillus wentii DTO 134E9 TaxID=1073089 RepID=A0A1L9RAV3_ASPWE|nr:uncharacterized protein ASPWEDRAFT_43993 [Aspergillus wentii DTO 134E9]KAI9934571.1 hypothetical protein MW887_000186 [Aspergillus wentii]OJJ31987.1 hypothetical protein ASPWEDRAFT_43993 [Aspergillus wentii DTO 134E9]
MPTIFITGSTGFIGSTTALTALTSGYNLRICLRKESQIPTLQSLFAKHIAQVEFVIVADLTDQHALRGKLDGVDYVLHMASPLPHGVNKETYFGPAVEGTMAVLREAARVESVKKVVVTSSIAALVPVMGVPEGGVIKEDNDWDFTVDPNADFTVPDNPTATGGRLYHASKLLANNETWKFWATSKPNYALVTLHPAYVFGPNLIQTTAEGINGSTNGLLFGAIMKGVPSNGITGVHVQDIADAHVKALDAKIPDGSKYLLTGEQASWKDVARIVKSKYPDAGAMITEDLQGESWATDTSRAERELGMRWRSWEEMIGDVMDQQLGFRVNKM